jgi:hypothetical protein
MQEVPVNYWAILVSGIASMALGYLWFGPLFGKMYIKLSGLDQLSATEKEEAMKSMTKSYTITFIGSLVMAWVLVHAIIFAQAYLKTSGLSAGLLTGFMSWLGFIATVSLGMVLWERKPWKLWFLTNGYQLVQLLIMGAILGRWR